MTSQSNDDQTIERLSFHIKEIIKILGEDPQREGLVKTPERSAKALLHITNGYRESVENVVGDAIFSSEAKEMVIVRDIEFYSICEHHLLPFFGHISVGYIPDGKIIGLSKIARIVDMFAKRLQLQEKLTDDVCRSLAGILPNKGVIVVSEADHLCMKMRGVAKQDTSTIALACTGRFELDSDLKKAFLDRISHRDGLTL